MVKTCVAKLSSPRAQSVFKQGYNQPFTYPAEIPKNLHLKISPRLKTKTLKPSHFDKMKVSNAMSFSVIQMRLVWSIFCEHTAAVNICLQWHGLLKLSDGLTWCLQDF